MKMGIGPVVSPGRRSRLEHMILISVLAVTASIVLYALYYYLRGAWQLLAAGSGCLVALAGLGISFAANRRQKPQAASIILLVSLLFVVGVVPLFIESLTPYIIVWATLLIVIAGSEILPGRWRIWLAAAVCFAVCAWLVDWWAPLPRYVPGPSPLPGFYLLGTAAAFLAAILWHNTLSALSGLTSIRARLLITSLLLVFLTGGAISYFSTVVLMDEEQTDAARQLTSVLNRRESEIEDWASKLQKALASFVRNDTPQLTTLLATEHPDPADYGSALGHMREDLQHSALQLELFDGLYVVDTLGNLLASAGPAAGSPAPVESDCMQLPSNAPCLQPPRHYNGHQDVAVVATVPVLDKYGQRIGLIVGLAGLEALNSITTERQNLGQTGVTYLVGPDQGVLTPVRPMQATAATLGLRDAGIDNALSTRTAGWQLYTDYRGVPVIGAYLWLPSLQVALVAEQDQTEAFRPSTNLLQVQMVVTLILLAAALVTALYVVRSITAPLGSLVVAAGQIAAGELELSAEVGQNDEIGAVARAFNYMTTRLRQAREQLEQRVQQRTEELAQANLELQTENAVRREAEHTVEIERNKLRNILDAMQDSVYMTNQNYEIEYANPALERRFGPINKRKCYEYLHGRDTVCPGCPGDLVWRGASAYRERSGSNGEMYEMVDTPVENADGTMAKLTILRDVSAEMQAKEEILQRNQELAALSRRLVEVQESERQYISRELHDETGQALTSLMLRMGMLERDMQQGMPVAGRVAELKQTVEEVLQDLHGLASALRPASLDHVGLVPALRQCAERTAERHGFAVDLQTLGLDEERLPPQMEITIYRIVQEALVNVTRHAEASHVDVIVERRSDVVRILVEDNGVGFDAASALESSRLGLLGIRERAESLGGKLVIETAPGAGATLLVEVPYASSYPDR